MGSETRKMTMLGPWSPPQNFGVAGDHWQIDLGLAYIVHLDWCCFPNPQGFMIWGCLRTCEVLVSGD